MQEISNIEIQNKIFRFIKNNPGIHISKIAETLNMNVDEIKKHLDILEKIV
jgi:predicted transcriptional regulator